MMLPLWERIANVALKVLFALVFYVVLPMLSCFAGCLMEGWPTLSDAAKTNQPYGIDDPVDWFGTWNSCPPDWMFCHRPTD